MRLEAANRPKKKGEESDHQQQCANDTKGTEKALTSNNQGADHSSAQLGRFVDECLRDEVNEGNDEGPHGKLVCADIAEWRT